MLNETFSVIFKHREHLLLGVVLVVLVKSGHVNVEEGADVEELVVPLEEAEVKSGHVKVDDGEGLLFVIVEDELGLEVVELIATDTFNANSEIISRWHLMMISKYQVTYCRFQIVICAFEVNGILLFCCWGNSGFLFDDKRTMSVQMDWQLINLVFLRL